MLKTWINCLGIKTLNIQGLRTKQDEVYNKLEKLRADVCVLAESRMKGRENEEITRYIHIYRK